MGEDIFLSIDPQVRESFLCRVEDLCKVAQTSLLVENFVGFAKLLAVGPGCTVCLENLTQSLDLVEEALASSLAIFRVQVVFFIGSLLEVVAHHNGVLKKEEIW